MDETQEPMTAEELAQLELRLRWHDDMQTCPVTVGKVRRLIATARASAPPADCYECGHALNGPYCPACNPPPSVGREEIARLRDDAKLLKEVEFAIYRYADCDTRSADRAAPHVITAVIVALQRGTEGAGG